MYYTYMWLREDGTPYYVGKGINRRAYWSHRDGMLKPPNKNRIIIQEFICEEDSLFAEKFLISYYGREDLGTGILLNLTDGGEGSSGYKPTKNSIDKMSKSLKGRIISEDHRKKISEALKGKRLSDNCLVAASKSKKEKGLSEEHKEKIRASNLRRWEIYRAERDKNFNSNIIMSIV